MRHQIELAYLGIEIADPSSLTPFFGDVIGLVPGEPAADGALTWRDDGKAHRLLVEPGPAEDATFLGIEAADDAAFDETADRLAGAGFALAEGSDADRAARRVDRLATTTAPWGVRVELVTGMAEATTPFSSPLMPGGFLTDHVGFGHLVFGTMAFDESHAFIVDGLGLDQSDWLEMELAPGLELEVRFYHCNERHHTLALAKAPFELPQVLHHVMFETNDRDDVGAAFDRVWASDLAIPNGLGRHDNDGMFSFYVASPAGFQVEVGHGARVITDDWDDDRRYDRISAWGHQPLRGAVSATSAPPPAEPEIDAEIVIVGCGPAGSTLAILLAQLGHRVVVLERWIEPYALPRAVHFDHEVARVLQSCGLGPALSTISEPAEVYEWRNATGTTLLRFGRVGAGASGWPESSMFNQPALEGLLGERLQQLPAIELRRGVEVTSLKQASDRVVVRGTEADGSPTEVTARFVIGCDGANSTVRGLIDVPVEDLGFFYDWLIVDVVLHEDRTFDPINLQICDPARPTTAVSGGPGRRRWEFMRLPHEQLEELNDERVAWSLLEPWDVTPDNATLERHAVYTFNARYAERWRSGRVLLAGDAAHQMPPFAGQGMCSGLRDAANLAWKLDLVLDGRAGDALLDTYAEERMPQARAVIDFSMELGKVICVPDPAEAAARDELMSAAVTDELAEIPPLPPMSGGLFRAGDGLAGHLFPQGQVSDGARRGLLDDLRGVGWRLVTVDPDPIALDADLAAWFESLGGLVVPVGGDQGVGDVDGAYAAWFVGHDRSWAMQRPDFQIYGTADSATDAAALVAALRDHLAPVTAPS